MKPKEVYVEIQLRQKHGLSLRQISVEVGCAVNTVRRPWASKTALKYERKVKHSMTLEQIDGYWTDGQKAIHPDTIAATVLCCEIAARR